MLLLASGLAAPIQAPCQPAPGNHRIGFIAVGLAAPNAKNVTALRSGLADLGYIEGRNLVIDFRWGDGKADQLPRLVNEILQLKPEVIVSLGGGVTARALKAATTTLPVVFVTGDPVAEGVVANLAHPGGNLTGLALLAGELEAKRLELLSQIIPKARRIAVVWNPAQPAIEGIMRDLENAGKHLGLTLLTWKARNKEDLEAALSEIAKSRHDALFIVADPVLGQERARIVEFARKQRLPGFYSFREFAEIGGLASYGSNLAAANRRAASFVDRILKGARPADLPVEQPTTFELVVNLKTARALGITVPDAVRHSADELIE